MKKIKTTCFDKLLALSSCFIVSNCDKQKENNTDEKYNHLKLENSFVPVKTLPQKVELSNNTLNNTLKECINNKILPSFVLNKPTHVIFRLLNPNDIITWLDLINKTLDSKKSLNDIYSTLIFYNACVHSFGNFYLKDDSIINFKGLLDALNKVLNEIKNKKNINEDLIHFDSLKENIPYGNLKSLFNDICLAFIGSKVVYDFTLPSEFYLSQVERDTAKAEFFIDCDQIGLRTFEIIKKVNEDMENWKHAEVDETGIKYEGDTSDGTFQKVDLTTTNNTKNKILTNLNDSSKSQFNFKDFYEKNDVFHYNPRSINPSDHINCINEGIENIKAFLTTYNDRKKEINRDSDEFKECFEKIDLEIERLLTAFIYRGIKYNQFLVEKKRLDSLVEILGTTGSHLANLENALKEILEYKGDSLKKILRQIFEQAKEIKKNVNVNKNDGGVSIDTSELYKKINEFNTKILLDRELFELAYNARRYLTDLFTGNNGDFIKNVNDKIINILKNQNDNDYGNFIKGVCNFLSTWDNTNNINSAKTTEVKDCTKWHTGFETLEYNKNNNPFILQNGKQGDISVFDFAFNDVQKILYDKYANCVLPETFIECQRLFKKINDICLTDNEGLFKNIGKLHKDPNFQNDASLRSLDLLKICLPTDNTKTDNTESKYSFYKRLPNENEYIKDAETWKSTNAESTKVENTKADDIINSIDKIPELVKNRKNDKDCPKIENAIGKLTNFILIDNPNEVINICNYQGYSQNFDRWDKFYCLNENVTNLSGNLGELGKFTNVKGENYKSTDNKISLNNFKFNEPKTMVAQCQGQDFGKNGTSFPALFADEDRFNVKEYTKFNTTVNNIEGNLYYLLCCIKTLGASIPRKFLKNDKDNIPNQNLLDAYRNCRNLSLLIENALTNILIACAKPKDNGGWEMYGWNDQCTLHTATTDANNGNLIGWGNFNIFAPVNKDGGTFGEQSIGEQSNKEMSPFWSDLSWRDAFANSWEYSFLDFKKKVGGTTIPETLNGEECGFFNPYKKFLLFGYQKLCWNKTDFHNFISSEVPLDNPGEAQNTERKCSLIEEYPYKNVKTNEEDIISRKKIIPEGWKEEEKKGWNEEKGSFITQYGDSEPDNCLVFNEKIAKTNGYIPFTKVLEFYYDDGKSAKYLALTKDNKEKSYSLETFGDKFDSYIPKDFNKDNHNFNSLLVEVKKHIEKFNKNFGKIKIPKSLQEVDFDDPNSIDLLKFYLIHKEVKYGSSDSYIEKNLLNSFIKSTNIQNLNKRIIKVDGSEKQIDGFVSLTNSKQFFTEIYGKADEDDTTKKKIKQYQDVFKLFNDSKSELQCGKCFYKNQDKDCNEYSEFDTRLKKKVEEFFEKVHDEWCKKVMDYNNSAVANDRTLNNIFKALGKNYEKLDKEVLDDVKTLQSNIDNIGFSNNYDGNSLKGLKDGLNNIEDALKKRKDLYDKNNTNEFTQNDQLDPNDLNNSLNNILTPLQNCIDTLNENFINSIFVLNEEKKNECSSLKTKLIQNKDDIDKYKTWLDKAKNMNNFFTELKKCYDNLDNKIKYLQAIDISTLYTLDDLKTLLGDYNDKDSIKNAFKDFNQLVKDDLENLFFYNTIDSSCVKSLNDLKQILTNLIKSDDQSFKDLENNLASINMNLFVDQTDYEKLKVNFQKFSSDLTMKIDKLQQCISDIDKILKDHLKDELDKVGTLLDETKETLDSLDVLTKTDGNNIYMEAMKYIADNKDKKDTSIGKLWAGVNNNTLKKVVEWEKENIKGTFYRSYKEINKELQNMLDCTNNPFEQKEITIEPDDDEQIKINNTTVIKNKDFEDLAKQKLFNEKVLEDCLSDK